MSETIDSIYSESDIADLRASGHWPAEETVDDVAKSAGKRADTTGQPA